MLLHLRVIAPPARTPDVLRMLTGAAGVTNVIELPGAGRRPEGDLVMFEVTREGANAVIEHLKELGIAEDGSIAAERVDLSLSRVADEAEEQVPGAPDDAVVWDELAAQVSDDCRVTWAFLTFLVIATLLAAIGVILPSLIVIVGGMVLGPEFGPVAAMSFGLLRRDGRLVVTAMRALVIGFLVAITFTWACAVLLELLGWIGPQTLNGHDEVDFIVKPDRWSFIVALLAGAAGVLSITAGKSSAIIGVFISVTTVPAAGYAAVAAATRRWDEVTGSVAQLSVNITGMVIAGLVTLLVQRLVWSRYGLRITPPAARRRRDSSV
ncbi:DUF389 domain-containing protein [Sphaerisporangium rubeum]|uniref:Putative hydrophobic protein (TIGR00271 family) n=1 Tax=Sphaerisporangium rubeum TaxID=321317 RepID=A0A7X0IDU6_9ACTN|nr:DUF389 domain-containing protein [Sphaerisporangium rubeum]MBB6471852.1 putative hydrophobic protein (TIGR00271 family) [Sphaerisporangium rubeum]